MSDIPQHTQVDQRRINVRGIVWRDGKLLAAKHLNKAGSESDYWATPGGGLDPFEPIEAGLVREFTEETGVEARIGNLLFIQQFENADRAREELEFFFHIENPDDFTDIDLTATTHGALEIARIEFIDPKSEHILPAFLSDIDIEDAIKSSSGIHIESEL